MKTRLISLVVLAIILATAPAAMASHCLRCKPLGESCVGALNYGYLFCEFVGPSCEVAQPCGSHAAPVEPLESEFTVASVERLDEPSAPSTQHTLVASADTPKPETR